MTLCPSLLAKVFTLSVKRSLNVHARLCVHLHVRLSDMRLYTGMNDTVNRHLIWQTQMSHVFPESIADTTDLIHSQWVVKMLKVQWFAANSVIQILTQN